jgi:hypothetical protein
MPAPKIGELARHRRGALSAAELNVQIAATWEQLLDTPDGRQKIAAALGVKPEDIKPRRFGQNKSPFEAAEDKSGFAGSDILSITGDWLVTAVVVPVLADLAKEEAKKRLTQLWKYLLSQRLQEGDSIKDSVS